LQKKANDGNSEIMGYQTGVFKLYVDRTPPPAPNPDDRVSGWSNDNTPTFTWSTPYGASGIAGYYWKVNSGSETWITSNYVTLPPQPDGTHTFYIKAKDNAGNIGNWVAIYSR